MFFKFNNITGRLTPSTQSAACSPQGLAALVREPSVITFDSKKTKPVQELPLSMSRPASSSAPSGSSAAAAEALGVVPSNLCYQRIVERQNIFLKNDGKLVWQKFAHDRASYYITVGLVVLGSAALIGQLYKWSFPKKSQD